jgi:hypothetical protein
MRSSRLLLASSGGLGCIILAMPAFAVKAAESAQLERWGERMLEAQSLSEVLDG